MAARARGLRVVLALETSGPGGAENMVVQLATALSDLGHDPIVATMDEGWMTERAQSAGLEVWVVPQRPGLDLAWVGQFARRLRREQVDVLHTHEFEMNTFGGTAALLARVRSLSTIHGKHWIADRPRRALAYRVLRRGGIPIVAVSENLAGFLSDRLRIRRDRILLVHNGIPLPEIDANPSRTDARIALGVPTDGPLLVAVGNLYPVKDHATLLRAVAGLPGVRVAVAGRGEEEENLMRLARELGIASRVHLLGLRDDIDRVLAAADLFVQPSLSEGLPLAILEAMAAGCPVVATRVGGVEEAVIHSETGLLIAPAAPAELTSALEELLAAPRRLTAMGKAARARAEAEFSMAAMADRYLAIYRALLDRGVAAAR
jgi:glycosyltransferase involved in cell wall biosynthesis